MCDAVPNDGANPNASDVKSLNARSTMVLYIDALINEVKKRPYLWDKKHKNYGCRVKVNRGWHAIAAIMKKRPEEVKAKWRNLKDSFHRLEKRIEFPPDDENTPIVSYYTGQWQHFEKLLFLRDTRHGRISTEDYIDPDVPEICIDDIKGEFDISDHSNASVDRINDKSGEPEKLFTEPIITLLNGANLVTNDVNDSKIESRKRASEHELEGTEAKRSIVDTATEAVIDEDLHFVKSLVPFLRKLNPIRKLIVRNEMQNLLIKEMLCEHCRSFGPQPNCRCNLS